MHAGQYKRIYNVAFALLVLCTFVNGLRVSKGLISTSIYEAERSQSQKRELFRQRPSYDDLVKEGKIEEAKKGEQLALKSLSVDRRIRFCEDNLGLLSTIATMLAYATSYFLFWFSGCLVVRYVRKAPNASPL